MVGLNASGRVEQRARLTRLAKTSARTKSQQSSKSASSIAVNVPPKKPNSGALCPASCLCIKLSLSSDNISLISFCLVPLCTSWAQKIQRVAQPAKGIKIGHRICARYFWGDHGSLNFIFYTEKLIYSLWVLIHIIL